MITLTILSIVFFGTSVYLFLPWLKIRQNTKKYREEYRKNLPKMEVIYVDKFGNNWFHFPNLLNLPVKRGIRGEVVQRMAKLGMTEEMFDQYMVEIKRLCNRNDLVGVAGYIDRMNERRMLPAEENSLVNLANAFFVLEGEDPSQVSDHWFARKKAIWAEDPDCYAFFLHRAMSLLRDISALSETDLLEFLQRQAVEKALHRL